MENHSKETIKISEIFSSIQGEGKYTGTPMLFIRASGCTRDCWYCDTKYHTEGEELQIEAVIHKIKNSKLDYVCWTGGEPLLQKKQIYKVIEKTRFIGIKHHLETNGDLLTFYDIIKFDYIACSPKDIKTAKKVKQFGNSNIDIKVVTDLDKEGLEIVPYATSLMPLTTYTKADKEINKRVWQYCVENSFKFSPRLQTLIYGKKEESKKAIIILSGGLDSTVLTYYLKNKDYQLKAVSFYYGQRHRKELEYAKKTTAILSISHIILDISKAMWQINSKSVLLYPYAKLPEEHYTHKNQKQTVVPNRNMIMLAFAISKAEEKGIKEVFYAAHKNDKAIYPDCRKEFIEIFSKASQEATYNKVKIKAPFVNKLKSEIVRIGLELKVPFENTWSCYKGSELACGKCAACQERLEAFLSNKVGDSLEYEKTFN